jgi:ubiquinone/menaquinone biosynthesis C-methylase UbiE
MQIYLSVEIKTMTYTIEETNFERQHLLAVFLEPLTLRALENISLKKGSQILDLGCGLGDTTLMLSEFFPGTYATGLDQDAALIKAANEEKKLLHVNLDFVCGDALALPFEDNNFDFVFCRYLLVHIPNAFAAMEEMKRVCKPGGIVFAQEYDGNLFQSYPESDAYPKLSEITNNLFADIHFGRKMIHYFKNLALKNIAHDAQVVLADHKSVLKKFYVLFAKALSKAILQRELLTQEQLDDWIKELEIIERNEDAIVLTHPTIAVWGTKAE